MNLKKQEEIAKEKFEEIEKKIKNKKTIKQTGKTKFYNFNQNNSGGSFEDNEEVCENVIIEAHSAKEANLLADNHGIYFDGVSQGIDCGCCGDRWHETWEDEGTKEPTMYGKPVKETYESTFRNRCIIYYLNGKKKVVVFKKKKNCPKHEWIKEYGVEECKICGSYKGD